MPFRFVLLLMVLPLLGLLVWQLRARPPGPVLLWVGATAAALLLLGHLRLPLHAWLGNRPVLHWGLFLLTTGPLLAGALGWRWRWQPAAPWPYRLLAAFGLSGAAGLLAAGVGLLPDLAPVLRQPDAAHLLAANARAYGLSLLWNAGSCALAGLVGGALALALRPAAAR